MAHYFIVQNQYQAVTEIPMRRWQSSCSVYGWCQLLSIRKNTSRGTRWMLVERLYSVTLLECEVSRGRSWQVMNILITAYELQLTGQNGIYILRLTDQNVTKPRCIRRARSQVRQCQHGHTYWTVNVSVETLPGTFNVNMETFPGVSMSALTPLYDHTSWTVNVSMKTFPTLSKLALKPL